MDNYGALWFALVAALGNAIFVAGQKKAGLNVNPLLLISFSSLFCSMLSFSLFFFYKSEATFLLSKELIYKSGWCGIGLFITYLGFYYLFSIYGASSYILYAVLSILTTSLIVGVVIFKETFNHFHMFSLVAALLSVLLFNLGQRQI